MWPQSPPRCPSLSSSRPTPSTCSGSVWTWSSRATTDLRSPIPRPLRGIAPSVETTCGTQSVLGLVCPVAAGQPGQTGYASRSAALPRPTPSCAPRSPPEVVIAHGLEDSGCGHGLMASCARPPLPGAAHRAPGRHPFNDGAGGLEQPGMAGMSAAMAKASSRLSYPAGPRNRAKGKPPVPTVDAALLGPSKARRTRRHPWTRPAMSRPAGAGQTHAVRPLPTDEPPRSRSDPHRT